MTHVLVIGMSHVMALANALAEGHGRPGAAAFEPVTFEIVNLREEPRLYDRKTRELRPERRRWRRPDVVCMAFEGNQHNVFSLLQTKQKFRIGDASLGSVPGAGEGAGEEDALFVPRDLLKMQFLRKLGRIDALSEAIRAHFPAARLAHLCAPPPVLSMPPPPPPGERPEGLNMMIYYLDFGACTPGLRMKIYDLQTEIFAELAARHGTAFLPPPEQARRPDGFLDTPFWDFDPTHGNARYGRLVLDQIEAFAAMEIPA